MRFFIAFILASLSITAWSQVLGGQSTMAFLQAPHSAKIAAIGGDNVSSFGQDPSMLYMNPALFQDDMMNKASFSFVGYVPGIKLMSAAYVFDESKIGPFAVGLNYMTYGVLKRRDEGGNGQGDFFANEFVLHGTKAFQQGNFVLGVTPKLAMSQIAQFTSMAVALDAGGLFKHPEKDFTVGLTFQNVGTQLYAFNDVRERLPFNAVVGVTFKPKHMPLKMSLTAHHLHQFDIVYYDDSQQDQSLFDSDSLEYKVPLTDKIFRHFTFGGEFILSPNFNLRIGYNYLRRRELRLENKSGGAGFSFGFMLRVKAMEVNFTKTYLNYAGRPTYLTINMDLDKMLKKKSIENDSEAPI